MSFFYVFFFYNEEKYFDIYNAIAYIRFWVVLLAVGVKIIDKSPNSFLKSDSKDDITKKEE